MSGHSLFDRFFSFVRALSIGDRFLFFSVTLIFIVSVLTLILSLNERYLITIPHKGGSYTEGIVGTPRFLNPVLATTNADQSLATLIYAGLVRLNTTTGRIENDMAESITISEDGIVYNVILRDDLFFHDGERVSAEDVAFTISRIQDPSIKSPLLASWDGIVVEYIDEREINFILPEPYAPFIENLTLGILPEHIWSSAGIEEFPFSQHNSEPIGSGPYTITRITRDSAGIPESYTLRAFKDSHRGEAHIETLSLAFFNNEDIAREALEEGDIEGLAGIIPAENELPASITTYTTPLPRTFAVFLNQNEQPLFRDSAVREALTMSTDRERIVRDVLSGYGNTITTPIPPAFGVPTPVEKQEADIEAAKNILTDGGWVFDESENVWKKETEESSETLSFSLTTLNTDILERTAHILQENWAAVGIPVQIKQFEQTDLTQSVIRPREYEALLFGTAVGRELDLFSFWHASQRNDPGLNVALYANITTDALLEDIRTTTNEDVREEALIQFSEEVQNDTPAVFLFVPNFVYTISQKIDNLNLVGLTDPHERFANIESWYIEETSVWSIFNN